MSYRRSELFELISNLSKSESKIFLDNLIILCKKHNYDIYNYVKDTDIGSVLNFIDLPDIIIEELSDYIRVL